MDDDISLFEFDGEQVENGYDQSEDENGKNVFSCKQCTFTTYYERGIKCHISQKHKQGKVTSVKDTTEEPTDDNTIEIDNENVVKSTQVPTEDNPGAEAIAKIYEESDLDLELDEHESSVIPDDDTINLIMKNIECNDPKEGTLEPVNEKAVENDCSEDLFTENTLLKSKLKSAEEVLKVKNTKFIELEEQMEVQNDDLNKLFKTVEDLKESNKVKNEEISVLLAGKNSLDELRMKSEEKVVRFMKTVEKLYSENNKLKKEIEKKNNTIELMNDGKAPPNTNPSDATKKIQEKLTEKSKKLEDAIKDKKILAKDLAKAEEKLRSLPSSECEDKRFEKLTALLKAKNKESKVSQDEIKRLSTTLNEVQEKINVANNKNSTLEAKNVRLEKQCDDLLEALEKDEEIQIVGQKPTKDKKAVNDNSKCKKHDKGRCHFGPKCNFEHASNTVCKAFSKMGFCKDEDECPDRHPAGVCLQWRRALCEKGLLCFYQHPDKEYGTLAKEGSYRGDQESKRKRSNSNEYFPTTKSVRTLYSNSTETETAKPSTDHFLYERMCKLEKELEFQKRKSMQPPVYKYMMTPSLTPAPPTTHPWATVAACPTPAGSSMNMGPWGSMVTQEQPTHGMSQFYQSSQ